MNNLIPFVSTHFILIDKNGYCSEDLTLGRVYKIKEWISEEGISFADDIGDVRTWVVFNDALKDASFKHNLKEILK